MPTRNVSLTDYLDAVVEEGVRSGRFESASEVVREGLRLLDERNQAFERKLERLRAAIAVGEESYRNGDYLDLDEEEIDTFLESL